MSAKKDKTSANKENYQSPYKQFLLFPKINPEKTSKSKMPIFTPIKEIENRSKVSLTPLSIVKKMHDIAIDTTIPTLKRENCSLNSLGLYERKLENLKNRKILLNSPNLFSKPHELLKIESQLSFSKNIDIIPLEKPLFLKNATISFGDFFYEPGEEPQTQKNTTKFTKFSLNISKTVKTENANKPNVFF